MRVCQVEVVFGGGELFPTSCSGALSFPRAISLLPIGSARPSSSADPFISPAGFEFKNDLSTSAPSAMRTDFLRPSGDGDRVLAADPAGAGAGERARVGVRAGECNIPLGLGEG